MKKIQLKFQKKVISVLTEEKLSKVMGGNTTNIFSVYQCDTVDGPCTTSSECADQDSNQGKCFSDLGCKGGGGTAEEKPYVDPPMYKDSTPCNVYSVYSNCLDPNKPPTIGIGMLG